MLDWLACALVRTASGFLCRVPPSLAIWVGERLGLVAARLQSKRTQIGLRNLRAAFDGTLSPNAARRIILACYRQLGAGMVELLRLPVIDEAYVDRYVTIDGLAHVERAIASGRPVILLTGHYGNWELSSIVAALKGHPVTALARAQNKLPKLYRLLVSYRESKGCRIVHKGGAMKQLIAALDHRQLIGIVGDQASRQGILADFFGRPALFATGPFELAHRKGAVIVPAFIHRARGPFHRLVVEPPLTLPEHADRATAVRIGVESFAAVLARHIREDPGQWLWMHKRWKRTPARRALICSDGKLGHVKQSLAIVDALREYHPALTHRVIEVRYRNRAGRAMALLWSWWLPAGMSGIRCLEWALAPETASALLGCYADVIISCGASTAPVNVLWSRANGAKSVVMMNPAPLPASRFDLVIAPRHDRLPKRPNIVRTLGALTPRISDEEFLQSRQRLQRHPSFRMARSSAPARNDPRAAQASVPTSPGQGGDLHEPHPVVAVFLGGDTLHYEVNQAFVEALLAQVKTACERIDGWYLVTTSRRTAAPVERLLAERLSHDSRCRLCLLATRDPLDGTMEGMLGSADVAVVTGESVSMVSEACASPARVLAVEPPRRANASTLTKPQRFLRDLAREGYARLVPVAALAQAIQESLGQRHAPKRLDNDALVRHAVSKLL
ncbi:MAG: mitochondrial fission ELM1 family protein [Candidatus Omnitrophica bacterium]|nr:mitochondrial fission ELM1 family protein [Candidatus Omnitrophota bacterium]